MQIPQRILDDFKAERKDVTPPLPAALKLVPLLFYILLGAAVLLGTLFFVQLRMASDRLEALSRALDQTNGEIQEVRRKREALQERILRAQDVESWVASSRPLQPLAVAIARSVEEGASIEELRFERGDQRGPQLTMDLRLGTRGIDQLDKTVRAIEEQNYRLFSPQQNVTADHIDFKSTIAWTDPASSSLSEPGAEGNTQSSP